MAAKGGNLQVPQLQDGAGSRCQRDQVALNREVTVYQKLTHERSTKSKTKSPCDEIIIRAAGHYGAISH